MDASTPCPEVYCGACTYEQFFFHIQTASRICSLSMKAHYVCRKREQCASVHLYACLALEGWREKQGVTVCACVE